MKVACSKCGSNHRVVVYRREPFAYECAVCAGTPRGDWASSERRPARPTFLTGQAFKDALCASPEPKKREKLRYSGPRQAHDPRSM
jgi:hypothetical protein